MSTSDFTFRRWLRFRLRTVLALTTVFAIWLGWQVSIVRTRQAYRSLTGSRGLLFVPVGGQIQSAESAAHNPWFFRRWLGDEPVLIVYYGSPEDREPLQRAFPEAYVAIPLPY